MSEGLTAADFEVLNGYADQGDRYHYWSYLQSKGDVYAGLALGVVTNETLAGVAANHFLISKGEAAGLTMDAEMLNDIGVGLMRADLEARKEVFKNGASDGGLKLDVRTIKRYHGEVFEAKTHGKLDVTAWTAELPLRKAMAKGDQTGDYSEAEAIWQTMMGPFSPEVMIDLPRDALREDENWVMSASESFIEFELNSIPTFSNRNIAYIDGWSFDQSSGRWVKETDMFGSVTYADEDADKDLASNLDRKRALRQRMFGENVINKPMFVLPKREQPKQKHNFVSPPPDGFAPKAAPRGPAVTPAGPLPQPSALPPQGEAPRAPAGGQRSEVAPAAPDGQAPAVVPAGVPTGPSPSPQPSAAPPQGPAAPPQGAAPRAPAGGRRSELAPAEPDEPPVPELAAAGAEAGPPVTAMAAAQGGGPAPAVTEAAPDAVGASAPRTVVRDAAPVDAGNGETAAAITAASPGFPAPNGGKVSGIRFSAVPPAAGRVATLAPSPPAAASAAAPTPPVPNLARLAAEAESADEAGPWGANRPQWGYSLVRQPDGRIETILHDRPPPGWPGHPDTPASEPPAAERPDNRLPDGTVAVRVGEHRHKYGTMMVSDDGRIEMRWDDDALFWMMHKKLERELERPATGPSGFNGRMHPDYVSTYDPFGLRWK